MAETFLSGFTESFLKTREARMNREQDQEDMMFKYKMDSLMKLREKREAKSAKEAELAKRAKDLAGQVGDANFASVAYKELSNDVSYEEMQKRIGEGYYVKNQDYTQPTQTIKTPAVPSAVKMTYDDDSSITDPEQKKRLEGVNKRIDEIDPGLRSGMETPNEFSTTTDDNTSPYVYRPKNEIKIGDMNDSLWKLHQAQQSGNPKAIRDAQAQVDINRRVETEKAVMQARANGKNVNTYVVFNPDGTINSQVPGEVKEDGKLYNVADPMNPQIVSGPVRLMGDDDIKRLNTLNDDFGKAAKDYNANSEAFVSALSSSQQMAQILADDPDAATFTSKGLGLIESLSGEAQAAYSAVADIEKDINAKIASGKTDGIEQEIADHAKALDDFLKRGVLSDANQQKAVNAAKFRSLKMQTAYQIAQATSTDGKVSNQDLANAMQVIGDNSDPNQIIPALNTQMQAAFLKLQSSQSTLNNNAAVADFEKRYGIKTGLRGQRIGDKIMSMDIPPEQKQVLMKYLGEVNKGYAQGQAETQQSIQQQQGGQPDEFGLVPNQTYPGKGGKMYRYKGGGRNPKNFEEVK